jgi:hypothetical protein
MLRSLLFIVSAAIVVLPAGSADAQAGSEPPVTVPQLIPVEGDSHMSENLRTSVRKTVVVAGASPPSDEIDGTYQKETAGLIGGMNEGSRLGTVSQEIGGVNVNFPIPILTIPGAIFGGLSGTTQREIQEFRDALTDELANAESKPLTNDGLALDVYREVAKLPNLQPKLFARTTPIPEDTDAVLFVSFEDIGINVQGSDAVITVGAKATLRRASDGYKMYEAIVSYQDRDSLSKWTENDNALWRDYSNFAAHFLGREVSAVVFDRVELQHELLPKNTDTAKPNKKNERLFVSKSRTPTLAWEFTLGEDNPHVPWAATIGEANIFYDVEIYDNHRLIYREKRIPDTSHAILVELEPCKTYRWSVRPSFHVDNDVRFGEWMRFEPDAEEDTVTIVGIAGRQASVAPAYIQDFASLEIKCGRR